MKTLTPKGVSDLTWEESESFDSITHTIMNSFKKNGYKKIRTPSIEFVDNFDAVMGPSLKRSAVKFFDHKGNGLMLRPDHTTPIARFVASSMQEHSLPLKLCYSAPIFRLIDSEMDTPIETFQAGIECISESSFKNDADIIRLCIDTVKALGIENFQIDIGHMSFLDNLDDEKREALIHGDYVSYGSIPLRGDDRVISDVPYLIELYHDLKRTNHHSNVAFNRGLIKGLKYYSGIIFECTVQSSRHPICSGGRYDHLLGLFGYDTPAIGFAFNVHALKEFLN